MLPNCSPAEAYRRIDFDARVAGSPAHELTLLCYEQLTTSLGATLHAHGLGDNQRKSAALTRALAALTALQLGIDAASPLAAAFGQLFAGARRTILDSVLVPDVSALTALRADFREIGAALASAS